MVTSDRDTIKGQIKYEMEANVVSMVIDGKIKTFSSHKVFYFEINDAVLTTFRQFYSIPHKVNFSYKIPVFFELLYEGPLSLLAREALVQQTHNAGSPYWGSSTYQRTVVQYSFFFLDTKGEITRFSGRKRDLLEIMIKKQSEVKKFIKENKLSTDSVRDLIRIVAFYNSI